MSNLENFTSLPPDKERHFVVYEEALNANLKKSKKVGYIVSAAVFVLVAALALSFDKPKPMMQNEDLGSLERADSEEPASTEAAAPASSDTSGSEGEAAAAEGESGEEAAAEGESGEEASE